MMRLTMAMMGVAGVMMGATLWRTHDTVTRHQETAMSFDIFFATCNLGTRQVQARNPFTGASMVTFDDPGLTEGERAAVAQLLHRMRADGPDTNGSYRLRFADGGQADLLAPHLIGEAKFDGCSVGTRSLTAEVVDFLFRLGNAGNMMIVPAAEGVGTLVLSDGQRQAVVARYPDAKVIRSAAALGEELRPGFNSAERYRNQVVGDGN